MPIKTAMRYHDAPISMAKIKKTNSIKFGMDVEKVDTAGGNVKGNNYFERQFGSFLKS